MDDAAVCRSAVHDAGRVPPVRRDAGHVHPDHRGAGRGRGQARPVHEQALPEREEIGVDIGREMRLSAARSWRRSSGAASSTTLARSACRTPCCSSRSGSTREERMVMNAHPVLGAEIIAPVNRLAPELPIIRHHHEWYNGSGYPDRLIGDEIPHARPDPARRRRVRGDDRRAPLPDDAADRRAGRSSSCASSPASSSTRSWSTPS